MELSSLFSPFKINQCVIPNRLVIPAMCTTYNMDNDGTCHERFAAYMERRAKGGWGLIVTGNFPVTEHAMNKPNMGALYADRQISGFKAMTDRVHSHGSKIFVQLYHAGRQSNRRGAGAQPVAPSSIPCPLNREMPAELTREQIHEIVEGFGDAAVRARAAGFDGVEVHGAHGYLLSEFISSNTNKRVDEYGGCLTNKMRIIKEVIDNIRGKVGADYPVTIRISASECIPGGREACESRAMFKLIEEYGYDAIHVSSGVYGNDGIIGSMFRAQGWIADFARQAKQAVSIPVITVNRITDPIQAEELIEDGYADFVAMGRASIADPDLPNKARDGRFDEIRYCLCCSSGCVGFGPNGPIGVSCSCNPETGREYTTDYTPVEVPKKVFVAGGGPGGMQAAITAAQKGHKVTLFERSDEMGGQFRAAAFPPYKGHLACFTAWQMGELKRRNVEIRMKTELTRQVVDAEQPDVVIVATGAHLRKPDVPGIGRENVFLATDVLRGKAETGENVVVVGGGETGRETAALLSMENKEVTLLKRSPICQKEWNNDGYLKMLEERHVPVCTEAELVDVEAGAVVAKIAGVKKRLPCDSVVISYGTESENALLGELEGCGAAVYAIGDAVKPRRVRDATTEAFELALSL